MDDIVKQAMAKWPNVPHCYGWLGLDARGLWRMRDEAAQARQLAGDRINHAALLGFINRNYLHDEQGRWYFQNGPQRVYIDLDATPFVARTDPALGFVLHTGAPLTSIEAVWMTDDGQLLLQNGDSVALLDDRDLAQCIADLRLDGAAVTDEQLMEWLAAAPAQAGTPSFSYQGRALPVQRIARDAIAAHFGFVQRPRPAES
ncbi:MAG: hypothetical protein JWQ23_2293 [Herminiimonas sp.]|nr:hypothetical protein [Herminiimonas sp.]